ncbi:MAG TPA: glycosyltransferase [Paludibaculum sp.]|jgi:glycosyltransferase involved in cell wall biosynthesis
MSDHQELALTVLLPTYNREPLLKEAIESLFQQTLDPRRFVVLVIDNCSADNTPQMIEEIRARSPFEIIYKRMEKNGGCFGSLNVGIEESQTEIIASFDSDCWADPKWLENGLDGFKDGDVAFVAGHIADKPGQPVGFFSVRNGAPSGENPFYPSGNCFYRKSVVKQFGGFDEKLSYGDMGTSPIGCADSDLAWRMVEAGLKHVYRGDSVVYHEVTTLKPVPWLKVHWRMVSIPALIRRHPGLRSHLKWGLFFLPGSIPFYVALLSLLLALSSPWFLLGTLPYLVESARVPGRALSLGRLLRLPARLVMLSLRQVVITTSLAYGSWRARTLVL